MALAAGGGGLSGCSSGSRRTVPSPEAARVNQFSVMFWLVAVVAVGQSRRPQRCLRRRRSVKASVALHLLFVCCS